MSDSNSTIGQRLQTIDILEATVSGLKQIIGIISADYGKQPVPVAACAGTWGQREIAKEEGAVVYPYMEIKLQQFTRNRNGYNETLRRRGINAPIGENSHTVLRFRLLPVALDFAVRYYSQDYASMLKWSKIWLNRDKDVRFDIKISGYIFRIKVNLTDSFNIPDIQNTEFATTQFVLETNCVVEGYIGDVETRHKIVKLVFNANLVSNTGTIVPTANNVINDQIITSELRGYT